MKPSGYITTALLALVWAGYYVANKCAAGHVSVFVIGLYIRACSFVILTVFLGATGKLRNLAAVRPVLPRLLLIGTLGFLLDISAFIGLKYSTAANAAILLKTDVLFANLITVLVYRQRIGVSGWLAMLLMLAGVFLVMKVDFTRFAFHGTGDGLIVLSALLITVNAFIIKGVQHNRAGVRVNDETIAFYNNCTAGTLFGIAAFFLMGPGEWGRLSAAPGLLLPLSIAAVCQSSLYLLYYFVLRRYAVWLVKLLLLLIPCFGVLLGYAVLGERPGLSQFAGMIVVIAGAAIILLRRDERANGPARVATAIQGSAS